MTSFEILGLTPYWAGVIGAGIVEFFAVSRAVAKMEGHFPERYKRWPFVATRIVTPFVSGTLPFLLNAETPLIAIYLGISAPIIVDKMAEGVMPKPLSQPSAPEISN